ncbi:MAG: ubiquinone/menaquinone biosynthesis methyltransferase, partial [Gammaproteobacteria bacterium]|nr:ubiquinone/menaquinone biosynthesis methyltransferase [Gammaproteobacteria bacterium]
MDNSDYTDFGTENVHPDEKRRRVNTLFDSVASNYDLMNDLMSFGIHRLWKGYAAYISSIKKGDTVLDVAGGTGDMAKRFSRQTGKTGRVYICDVSYEMLHKGRGHLIDSGGFQNIELIQGDAEQLPFKDNQFDLICIAFGLRNVTDKNLALRSMYSKLKFGGQLLIVEFSDLILDILKPVYRSYSDYYIPVLGKYLARDEPS